MDFRSRCIDCLLTDERAEGTGEGATRDEGAGEALMRCPGKVSSFLLYVRPGLTISISFFWRLLGGTVLTWGFAGVGATESYASLTPPAAMRE
jgi:hypothetical protein